MEELCLLRKWKNYVYYVNGRIMCTTYVEELLYYASGRIMFIAYVEELCVCIRYVEELRALRMWKNYLCCIIGRIMCIT